MQRISWRYVDGPWDTDFIESPPRIIPCASSSGCATYRGLLRSLCMIRLNGDWKGVGTPFCGHPNFATWAGFSMSSRHVMGDRYNTTMTSMPTAIAQPWHVSSPEVRSSSTGRRNFCVPWLQLKNSSQLWNTLSNLHHLHYFRASLRKHCATTRLEHSLHIKGA